MLRHDINIRCAEHILILFIIRLRMTGTTTIPQDFEDNFVSHKESLPQVCLQHRFDASIAPISQNSRNPAYFSASSKKPQVFKK